MGCFVKPIVTRMQARILVKIDEDFKELHATPLTLKKIHVVANAEQLVPKQIVQEVLEIVVEIGAP